MARWLYGCSQSGFGLSNGAGANRPVARVAGCRCSIAGARTDWASDEVRFGLVIDDRVTRR
jgi:hypothetical protein